MKLTDILRQINEEEEDTQQGSGPKVYYDPAVKPEPPSTIKDIVDALTDINNYDKTLKTKFALRDGSSDGKEAFPKKTNPNELIKQAREEWVKLSEDGKLRKIKNIKNRIFTQTANGEHVPNYVGKKAWEENIANNDVVQDAYNDWENEGNEGSIEDYLASLTFEDLKNTGLLGSKGVNYWPQKPYTKDQEIALNQATMREGENFIVTDDRVIFPLTSNKPFLGTQGEQGLRNIVDSILKNANVSVEQADVVRGTTVSSTTQPTPTSTPPPTAAGPSVLTLTLDPDKIKGKKLELNAMVKLLQNTYDKNFDYDKENNVIKITNIKPERRADVRSQFAKFLKQQSPVKESLDFDFERYQMLRRAGIIK